TASYLEFLAGILDLADGAENLGAKLAVRLADHFHRMLVVHDVACLGVDADLSSRSRRLPMLDFVDESIAVKLAVELFDGMEDGVNCIPGIRRLEIGIIVGTVSLVPCLDECLVGSVVEIVAV